MEKVNKAPVTKPKSPVIIIKPTTIRLREATAAIEEGGPGGVTDGELSTTQPSVFYSILFIMFIKKNENKKGI